MTEPNEHEEIEETTTEPNWRRKLEADAKAGREAMAALAEANANTAAAQRELVMRRANVDIESPLGQMFAKAYDGPADVDSVISQWSAVTGQPPPDTSGVSPEQQAQIARISGAVAGAQPTGAHVPDFGAELDSIPVLVDGQWNPTYVQDILAKTAAQAAREGRPLSVDSSGATQWMNSTGQNSPAIKPLR